MAVELKRKETECLEKDLESTYQKNKTAKLENKSCIDKALCSFDSFRIVKVLSENAQTKTVALQGEQIYTYT